MNPYIRRFIRYGGALWLISLTGLTQAQAEEKDSPPPKPPARMIEIEAHFFRATNAQLLQALKSTPDSGALKARLLADGAVTVTKEGVPSYALNGGSKGIIPAEELAPLTQALHKLKVDFFSSPRLVTKSGQRALAETVRELRYPTEFSPPEKAGGFVTPTAFETRNVGVTVEIEPEVGPDQMIDVKVTPSVVTFLGFIDYSGNLPAVKNGGPDKLDRALGAPLRSGGIWQPIFYTSKISMSVGMSSGSTVLLGGLGEYDPKLSLPAGENPNRLIYVLLTARVVGSPTP